VKKPLCTVDRRDLALGSSDSELTELLQDLSFPFQDLSFPFQDLSFLLQEVTARIQDMLALLQEASRPAHALR